MLNHKPLCVVSAASQAEYEGSIPFTRSTPHSHKRLINRIYYRFSDIAAIKVGPERTDNNGQVSSDSPIESRINPRTVFSILPSFFRGEYA